MTLPFSVGRPGKSERSHGTSRYGHPDSDYQTTHTELPWEVADREQGSKRGGFTAEMRRQAELRLDATNTTETVEEMLYVLGNPDAFGPDQPIVQEQKNVAPSRYKSNTPRTGVYRQE